MEEKPQCIYIKKTYKIFVFCICSIMFYHGIWNIFIFNKTIFIWRIKDTSTRRKFFTDWTNPVCINLAITPFRSSFICNIQRILINLVFFCIQSIVLQKWKKTRVCREDVLLFLRVYQDIFLPLPPPLPPKYKFSSSEKIQKR